MTTIYDRKEWNHEDLVKLLRMYKAMPELWDQMSENYNRKGVKMDAYNKLAKHFSTTIKEIRRKIHNIRCQFNFEVRKIKQNVKKNVQLSEIVSDWKYFNDMTFLLVCNKQFQMNGDGSFTWNGEYNALDSSSTENNTVDYILAQDLDSDAKSDDTNCESLTQASTSRESQLNIPKSEEIFLIDEDEYHSPKKRRLTDDDHRIFGEHVASELRNLSENAAKKLKLKIRKAILEVAEEEYNIENGWD